jgi:hypothetical protein
MTERSKTLAEIQEDCRRFADEVCNPVTALILYRAAYDLHQIAGKANMEGVPTRGTGLF